MFVPEKWSPPEVDKKTTSQFPCPSGKRIRRFFLPCRIPSFFAYFAQIFVKEEEVDEEVDEEVEQEEDEEEVDEDEVDEEEDEGVGEVVEQEEDERP